MKQIIQIFTLFCFIFCPAVFASDSDLYQINIVVFEHLTSAGLNAELWQPINITPNLNTATTPNFLPKALSALNQASRQLSRKKEYNVLLNTSWQQHIPIGQPNSPTLIVAGNKYDNTNQLVGTIAINRSRYFNVKFNLLLTEPHDYLDSIDDGTYADSIADGPLVTFQLLQNRRMKSNELNYIDHPLFGALIKITKVTSTTVI